MGKPCGTCKGKGYRKGYDHVQHGKCFTCSGFGSVEDFNKHNAILAEKAHLQNIEDTKREIVHHYKTVKKWEGKNEGSFFVNKARENAKKEMKRLREWGITFTIEEIEEMSKQ
jgi:RecJ-like exonuclease